MTIIAGVEEAGRGPVIGPLVMCITTIEKSKEKDLTNLGVKDSKLLSPKQRQGLFDQITNLVLEYKIIILSPQDVDSSLNDPDMNLNWLEGKTSAKLINEISCDTAILDCPSTNIQAYADYVRSNLTKVIQIIAEHKADLNHPIVSAASILAKVTRDAEIEKIKSKINIDFGSGYPSDPKTVAFLEKYWNTNPDIFRKTWSSYKKYSNNNKQTDLSSYS